MHSALTPSLPPRRDNVLYMYLSSVVKVRRHRAL